MKNRAHIRITRAIVGTLVLLASGACGDGGVGGVSPDALGAADVPPAAGDAAPGVDLSAGADLSRSEDLSAGPDAPADVGPDAGPDAAVSGPDGSGGDDAGLVFESDSAVTGDDAGSGDDVAMIADATTDIAADDVSMSDVSYTDVSEDGAVASDDVEVPDIADDDATLGDSGPDDMTGTDTSEPAACRGSDPYVWQDLSGFQHHGRLSDFDAAPVWEGAGLPTDPWRLEMPGTPLPRIELGGSTALRLREGTAEFWVRADSTTFANKMLYNHRNDAEIAGVVVISQNNEWKALGAIENHGGRWTTVFAAPGHQVGVWQHVVLTWRVGTDGRTTLTLHVDGVATGSGSMGGDVFYSNKGTAQMGGLNGGWGSFDGGIAVARMWDVALTAEEVRWLFNQDALGRFGRALRSEAATAPLVWPIAWFDATPCP